MNVQKIYLVYERVGNRAIKLRESLLDRLPLYLSPVFQSSLCEFLCVLF